MAIILLFISVICFLTLLSPLYLEINTKEHNYLFRISHFFSVQYADQPKGVTGLRLSFLGYSWYNGLSWFTDNKKEKKSRKFKERKENQFPRLLLEKRKILYGVLGQLKVVWCDLQRFSDKRLEINLCTPDFMLNALLAVVLAGWGIKGAQINVNYVEENWLIFHFDSRLWVLLWVFLRFTFSQPVLKFGFSILHDKFMK